MDPALEKESWISSVLLEWGSCGKILYVDGVPAAYVLFAPPQYVPRSVAFPTSPVSADAVLLMTARVLSEFSGGGLGRMLIQGMAKDLTRRGVRAIEAFGDKQWTAPACVLPVDYLLAVGFKTVRPHHRNPRLRMELRTALTLARGRRGRPGAAARLHDPRPGAAAAEPGRGEACRERRRPHVSRVATVSRLPYARRAKCRFSFWRRELPSDCYAARSPGSLDGSRTSEVL